MRRLSQASAPRSALPGSSQGVAPAGSGPLKSDNDGPAYRSGSNGSSQDDGFATADGASTAAAGTQQVPGWDAAADYKDTVLFLARQQSMQYAEIMQMLQTVVSCVTNPAMRLTPPSPGSSSLGVRATAPAATRAGGGEVDYVSSHDHRIQHLLQNARDMSDAAAIRDSKITQVGGYTGTQTGWLQSISGVEVELHAAKARISELEAMNRLLQQQVVQREETIKILTEANIQNLTKRIGSDVTVSSHLSPLSPTFAEARRCTATTGTSAPALTPNTSTRRGGTGDGGAGTTGGAATATTPNHQSKPLFEGSTSPALRKLLQKHNDECQRVAEAAAAHR